MTERCRPRPLLPILEKSLTVFAGQFCMTGSRVLVQREIAEQVIDGLAARLTAVKPGPATDASSDMGPLISKTEADRVDAAVKQAIEAGAEVIVRGGLGRDLRAGPDRPGLQHRR